VASTSKQYVTVGNRPHDCRLTEVTPQRDHVRVQAHLRNGLCDHVDFQPVVPGIVHRGVQNPVEVLLFNTIRIHQYQRPNP
jgi:hypothetical protein